MRKNFNLTFHSQKQNRKQGKHKLKRTKKQKVNDIIEFNYKTKAFVRMTLLEK